jgi:hypothetical protein
LDLGKRTVYHDGRKKRRYNSANSIEDILHYIHEYYNSEPFILMIDEFQNGRTLDEEQKDRNSSTDIDLWELLDTGRLQAELKSSELSSLMEMRLEVNRRIRADIPLTGFEEGEVSFDVLRIRHRNNSNDGYDVLNSCNEELKKANEGRFEAEVDVYDYLISLTQKEVLSFIDQSMEKLLEPKDIDGTKGLIFVAGNIDEAYREAAEFDQEMDADALAERCQQISVHDIKIALGRRFRKEQISRLGNNHIIYPSFKSSVFRDIIKDRLKDASAKFYSLTGYKLDFTNQLIDLIYEEGVIPAQGTRPLFATIQLWVNAQFPKIMEKVYEKELSPDTVLMDVCTKRLKILYKNDSKTIFEHVILIYSDLEKMRNQANKDERYIIAVHEAGHVISSMLLLNKIPKKATAISTSSDRGGFVLIKHPRRYYKQDLLAWIGCNIAGGIAERIVFGEDHFPLGASNDHKQATSYILTLIKSGIIGEVPATYANRSAFSEDMLYDDENRLSSLAIKWLQEAKELVQTTLNANEFALVKMADLLLTNNYLLEEQLSAFAGEHFQDIKPDSEEEVGLYAKQFHKRLNRN